MKVLSVSGVNRVSCIQVLRTCGFYHSGADICMRRQTRTGYRSSGLATKQLSAVVASGASTGKAEEVNTLISSTIPECCVLICLSVLLDCFPSGLVTLMQNHPKVVLNMINPTLDPYSLRILFFCLFVFLDDGQIWSVRKNWAAKHSWILVQASD